jgi:hypothetical protein
MIALIIIVYIILGIIIGSIAYVLIDKNVDDIYSENELYCFVVGLFWPFAIVAIPLFELVKFIIHYTINTVYIKLHKIPISDNACFVCKHYRNTSKLCKMDFKTKKCENFKKDKFWKFKHILK